MTEQEKNKTPKQTPADTFEDRAQNLLSDFGAEKKPVVQEPPAAPEKSAPAPKPAAPKKSDAPKSDPTKKTQAKVKNQSEKDVREPARAHATTASATKKSTPKKETAADKKQKDLTDLPRSARPAHRVIPYVLALLAVFIGISLLLNLFCNQGNRLESDPGAHWMGFVGYYICYGLFGLFGPAVFVLPLLLANLALFWRKYVDHSIAIAKILVSFGFMILLGAVIHVCCLQDLAARGVTDTVAYNYNASSLLHFGAQMTGGGLLGGKLGYTMVYYLNVVGSLIVGIFLLAVSLFYFLGMTPQHLWRAIRRRRAARPERVRVHSHSEEEAEAAHKQAKMDEKIRKITAKQAPEQPNEAVEVVRPAPQKRSEEDKLAPMPQPRLEPTDGSRPFVPGDIGRKLNEANRAAAQGQAVKAPAPAASTPTPAPAPQKPNPAQNRDTAVDPIFPKSNEAKQVRRVPKQDRNFDLHNVFLDLNDSDEPTARKHAPIPPEVPMKTGARPAAQRVEATVAQRNEHTAAPAAKSPAPKAPEAKVAEAKASETKLTQGMSGTYRPAQTSAGAQKAPSLSAVKPATGSNANANAKPIFRQADKKQPSEYGLSNEQFEQLEAQQKPLPKSAPAAKEAAKKPAATTADPKAPAKEAAAPVVTAKPAVPKKYVFPPISYLQPGQPMTAENRAEIEANMKQLAETLASFHVRVQEINFSCGPTVTRYEVVLAPGVRVRSVTNLSDDIALALRSPGGVRIEAPIPGTNAVGIEVPNQTRSTIYLRDLIESKKFKESKSKLSACLGADIAGEPLIFDIAKMPHLLVAGTTGSGKSVCINCIITSLLYKVRPDEVKLVLIDPKKVEFSIYKNIPHLMAPVVTLPKDAAGALQAAVEEMERRFEIFESVGVRDLKGYNSVTENDPDMPFIPHIVIIIDELADLMMTAKNEVETAICRIAQKARAAGMHLIIGTQRPSADVVTGLIKANVPSCIAFAVKSQIDSRVILDHGGAEALTGRGDMLFVPIGSMRDTRVQGAFVDDKEVENICDFIRAKNGLAQYDEKFIAKLKELAAQCGNKGKSADDVPPVDGEDHGDDPKYNDAVRVAVEEGRISTSLLQRKLGVGYSRAAKLIDRMQSEEIVSPPDGSKPRSILITPEQYLERFVDNADS